MRSAASVQLPAESVGVGLDELLIKRPELRFAFGSCAAHLGAQKHKCRAR